MIMVRTIQGDRIPIKGATENDLRFNGEAKVIRIKGYYFNWDQILYVRIIDEEEA